MAFAPDSERSSGRREQPKHRTLKRDCLARGHRGEHAGALAFVAACPALQPVIKRLGDMGKITLSGATGTSPWVWIAALVGLGLAALALVSSRRKPVADEQHRVGSAVWNREMIEPKDGTPLAMDPRVGLAAERTLLAWVRTGP